MTDTSGLLTDEDQALADVLAARLSRLDPIDRASGGNATWQALTEVGVLGIGSSAAGGTPLTAVAVAEQLGAAVVGGPVLASTAACIGLDDATCEQIAAGRVRVTIGDTDGFPWGDQVDVSLEATHDRLHVVRQGGATTFDTLAGDGWTRAEVESLTALDVASSARIVDRFDLLVAAYVAGAAEHLLRRSIEHARQRHQFGRPIGNNQAVAFPLVDAWTDVTSARLLTHHAAVGRFPALVARHAATRAGVAAATTAHQVFGAIGYSAESGVGAASKRIRQTSLLPPSPQARTQALAAGLATGVPARVKTKQP